MSEIAAPRRSSHDRAKLTELVREQCNVLVALILRDIKTRFFGSAWGFLLSLAWPLTHILILLLINAAAGRLAPYGDSAALWFATGIVPFIAFSYMSRFIMMGLITNRPLLIFPNVNIMDILLARAIVEVLSAGAVILILIAIFVGFDIPFMPARVVEAFQALGASFLLGLGVGIIAAILAQAIPVFAMVYLLSIIVIWIMSGVFFVPDNLPGEVRYYLSFNPLMHCVGWFRQAYYDNYGEETLDRFYCLGFGAACLFGGLLLERLVRGRLLQG